MRWVFISMEQLRARRWCYASDNNQRILKLNTLTQGLY